jgi:uncharacterized protein (DUF433 family)
MAESVETVVVEGEIEDEPHIRGSRVTVQRIGALLEQRGLVPETIADRLDLPREVVLAALAYYFSHYERTQRIRERRLEKGTAATDGNPSPQEIVKGSAFDDSPTPDSEPPAHDHDSEETSSTNVTNTADER